MTPSEVVGAGIADVKAHVQEKYKIGCASLSVKDRFIVMTDLDGKETELPTVPTATFFGFLLHLAIEAISPTRCLAETGTARRLDSQESTPCTWTRPRTSETSLKRLNRRVLSILFSWQKNSR
jgi:hypothetical protein